MCATEQELSVFGVDGSKVPWMVVLDLIPGNKLISIIPLIKMLKRLDRILPGNSKWIGTWFRHDFIYFTECVLSLK